MSPLIIKRKSIHHFIALLVAITLIYQSGWRDEGLDRNNYIILHELISQSDGWEKLIFAKDVTFFIISYLVEFLALDVKWIFLASSFFAVFTKYIAVKKISPKIAISFMVIYAILLSPGLEFAAIRSATAIGFLMCAMVFQKDRFRFFVFSLLAIGSHLTTSIVIFAIIVSPLIKAYDKHKISYIATAVIIFFSGQLLIDLFPQGYMYQYNKGNLPAYLLPLITLMLAFIAFRGRNRVKPADFVDSEDFYIRSVEPVVFILIAISFGFVENIVTASGRYLEVAWCLLLPVILINFNRKYGKVNLLMFFVFMTAVNVRRNTWLAIFDPGALAVLN